MQFFVVQRRRSYADTPLVQHLGLAKQILEERINGSLFITGGFQDPGVGTLASTEIFFEIKSNERIGSFVAVKNRIRAYWS